MDNYATSDGKGLATMICMSKKKLPTGHRLLQGGIPERQGDEFDKAKDRHGWPVARAVAVAAYLFIHASAEEQSRASLAYWEEFGPGSIEESAETGQERSRRVASEVEETAKQAASRRAKRREDRPGSA
jgi:hypothetical protein